MHAVASQTSVSWQATSHSLTLSKWRKVRGRGDGSNRIQGTERWASDWILEAKRFDFQRSTVFQLLKKENRKFNKIRKRFLLEATIVITCPRCQEPGCGTAHICIATLPSQATGIAGPLHNAPYKMSIVSFQRYSSNSGLRSSGIWLRLLHYLPAELPENCNLATKGKLNIFAGILEFNVILSAHTNAGNIMGWDCHGW